MKEPRGCRRELRSSLFWHDVPWFLPSNENKVDFICKQKHRVLSSWPNATSQERCHHPPATPHPPHTLTPCPLHRQRGSPWVIVVNELASLLTRCLNRAVGLSPPPLSALSPPSWTFLELRRRVKRGQHPLLHWPWERLSSHSFWLPCTWWTADRDSTESRKNYRTIISKGVYTDKRREVQLIWTGFPRNKEEPRGRLTGRFYVSH